VYYVQYAHARICSILRKAAAQPDAPDAGALAETLIGKDVDLSVLTDDAELALFRKLAELSEVVEAAARAYAPHKLTRYAEELATCFHQFYTVCRVIDPERPRSVRRASPSSTRPGSCSRSSSRFSV